MATMRGSTQSTPNHFYERERGVASAVALNWDMGCGHADIVTDRQSLDENDSLGTREGGITIFWEEDAHEASK